MDTIDTTRCESCNFCYQDMDWDGRCYRCGHQIFNEDKGYTLEEAGNFVITGCPYCHYSYCE